MKFSELVTLAPGTVMEGGHLLPSVTDEPLVYRVIQSAPESVLMEMLFLDVPVGHVTAVRGTSGGIKLGVVAK